MNAHMIALCRYVMLRGSLDDLPDEERDQALADRELYGRFYAVEDDRGFARAVLSVRFMHEVCNVPLAEARAYVIAMIRQNGCFKLDHIPAADAIASEFVMHNLNVLMAEAAIDLYRAAAEGSAWARFWERVLDALRHGQPCDCGDEPGPSLH